LLTFAGFGLSLFCSASQAQASDFTVVFLKPVGCSLCGLFEESLKRRGQVRELELEAEDGSRVVARVERRGGVAATLSEREAAELYAVPGFDRQRWEAEVQANEPRLVLLRDGRAVAGGSVNRSIELRDVAYPVELTAPPENADPERVRDSYGLFFRDLYLQRWDPGFLLKASAVAPQPDGGLESWLVRRRIAAAPVADRNVLLMATASGPVDNEVFNAERIEGVRLGLLSLGVPPASFRVFHGGEVAGANAVEEAGGRRRFVSRQLEGAQPFRLSALASQFEGFRSRGATRNLLVLIGHGGPEGAGMWGEPGGLTPGDLGHLHRRSGSDTVLVSGNCYGGVMARATSCGFFGARPDLVATGCQANAAEIAASQDYVHVFFNSLKRELRSEVDANRDGEVSFDEAHWETTLKGDPRNITYTTVDAYADAWFEGLGEQAPVTVTLGELRGLAERTGPAEQRVLRGLTGGLTADYRVSLRDLAAQGREWSRVQSGPRPVLGQLARRMLYLESSASAADPALAAVRQCGTRSVEGFLSP
jgi:hypothetical protein